MRYQYLFTLLPIVALLIDLSEAMPTIGESNPHTLLPNTGLTGFPAKKSGPDPMPITKFQPGERPKTARKWIPCRLPNKQWLEPLN
jgi:hypothetical protein